jgi:hypothetical protein
VDSRGIGQINGTNKANRRPPPQRKPAVLVYGSGNYPPNVSVLKLSGTVTETLFPTAHTEG